MQSKAPPNQCVWPVEEAPEEPLVCVAHLAEATIRFEHKLYYIMGHRDCPKGHFMEQDEMDNDGQSCMPSDDGGFSECPRMPLTTGRKLKFCKGGPTSDDRYGLVKLNGVERLSTPLNPYKITIEDIVIRCVSGALRRFLLTRSAPSELDPKLICAATMARKETMLRPCQTT
jgi:hypothetical protein